MLVGKAKLDTINLLISKALINSYISPDQMFSANNMFRECNKVKEEIRNPKNAVEYTI